MKLEPKVFTQLRMLAPFLDDVLSARELEDAEQALKLAALAHVCSMLCESYSKLHPDDAALARSEAG